MTISNEFLEACENGNLNKAKQALKEGANLYAIDEYGNDALMLACSSGDLSIVEWLFSIPFDINRKTDYRSTALNWAVQTSMDIVKFLLTKGMDINEQDDRGRSPLFMLVDTHCEPEKVEILLKNGANINIEDKSGWTALMTASYWDKRWNALTKFLLDNGADINHQSKDGWTPLLLACHDRVVADGPFKILIEDKNIDVNKPGLHFGWTPLMQAVGSKYFCEELVMKLVERGANVNATMNITPHKKLNPDDHKSLYEDVKISTKFQGYTALMWAIKKKRGANTIKLLCDAGANVNHKSANGDTPLSLVKVEKTKSLLMKYA